MRSTLVTLFLAAMASAGTAQTCEQIKQNGVTFAFEQSYPCGTFANGDYWIAPEAPDTHVVITAITPAFDGARHGWEVNPADPVNQGFDDRIGSFDASRVPTLPYAAHGGESIVKGVSVPVGTCRPCLKSAAILTVLGETPAGQGAGFWRPPYPGQDKRLIDVGRLRMDLLPALPTVSSAPSLTAITSAFQQPWLDHKSGWTGRPLHPEDSMPNYGADIAAASGNGALALMLAGDEEEKRAAAIRVVQVGLDLFHAYQNGTRWKPNGGHSPGRRILLALAATLIDDPAMISAVRSAPDEDFGEDGSLVLGAQAGIALWGQACSELQYWNRFRFETGSKTCVDPYGFIDGGEQPGGSYQFCCNSSPWRGAALALRLLPTLQCAWPAVRFLAYVDRWVARGAHAEPDPCAGYDGVPDNYGITYGPDGAGGCIADTDGSDGIGRFPDSHGINANQGNHGSPFHGEMWEAYRASAPTEPIQCGLVFSDGFESGDTAAWHSPVP